MVEMVLLTLILVSVWFGFFQIVKQQGRIILRLDELESRIPARPAEPPGLPIGAEIPSFKLPNLAGKEVALEDFRGQRVLLVYWSPSCGFCDMIAPDLARLYPDLRKQGVELVLLAHGEADANVKFAEEHGLRCPILLLKDREVPPIFRTEGTPVAYLLDAEGRTAKHLAVGADEVPALAEAAAKEEAPKEEAAAGSKLPGKKPLSASKIVRDGLKAGTPAPSFSLPDIYGKTISLDEYRGRPVLLVFSDPHCGPCDELAPKLARFEHKHRNNGLSLVMIGRDDPAENRKKAEEHGIKFPVVVQGKWKVSKDYGIFATPVAFLVNGNGVIAKDVAIGPDPILALAEEGLRLRKEEGYELSHR